MFGQCDSLRWFRAGACRHFGVLSTSLLLSGAAAAQDTPSPTSPTTPSSPAATGTPLRIAYSTPVTPNDALTSVFETGVDTGRVRRITLPQAQQLAVAASPLQRLGQLQVEAAEQHRLGVKAQYFPSVSGQFETLHLSQQPGEILSVRRPLAGTTLSVPVAVIAQDQYAVNFTVVQPITPLFQVRQLVKIARADENIARAKAGMPVTERAGLVEKNYFDLLVAERELVSAGAAARKVARWLTVSDSSAPGVSTEQQKGTLDAAKSWSLAASRVKALTASLAGMLGLPLSTRFELVPPEPLVEHLSLDDAAVDATAANAEIIEAEQTAAKARAGSTLAKSAYIPSVAVLGGYLNQTALADSVLPRDFAYVGVIATYTLFDSGKREHTVKELSAQVQAAELGVELTKAKVAAAVKTSYLELERSRELVRIVRRMAAAPRVVDASYLSNNQQEDAARADMEADLFRAELEHRQAYAKVKTLIGNK